MTTIGQGLTLAVILRKQEDMAMPQVGLGHVQSEAWLEVCFSPPPCIQITFNCDWTEPGDC